MKFTKNYFASLFIMLLLTIAIGLPTYAQCDGPAITNVNGQCDTINYPGGPSLTTSSPPLTVSGRIVTFKKPPAPSVSLVNAATGGAFYITASYEDAGITQWAIPSNAPLGTYYLRIRKDWTVSGINPTPAITYYCDYNFQVVARPNCVSVVSSASYISPIAKNSLATIFGSNMASTTATASSLPLPTMLGNTRLRIRFASGAQYDAALQYVSPGQINFLVPDTGNSYGTVRVEILDSTSGQLRGLGNVRIDGVAPGLFTANGNGQGVPAATALRVRADGSQVYESIRRFDPATNKYVPTPINLGPDTDSVYLVLSGTGIRHASSVTCTIGNINSPVTWFGADISYVGSDQVNVLIPRTLMGRGEVDLKLNAVIPNGSGTLNLPANTVRVSIQ